MKAALYGLLVLTLGAGTAAAQSTTTPGSIDSTLDSRIEKRIHNDATLKKYDIGVSVDNRVAKLTGTVPTHAAKSRAERLAKVPGITHVDNAITVDANVHSVKGTTGRVTEKTKDAAEKTRDAAGKVANKTVDGVQKTGEVATDTYITTRVKSKFIDESVLKGSDIKVETNNHVVTLTGTVPTEAARARAIEQAKEVEGVHQVVDRLTVGPRH
jgi:osmotically-inducible protein OsmY